MTRRLKKTELIQARVPYGEYQTWHRTCEGNKINSSEALRAAMLDYIGKLARKTLRIEQV